MQNAYSMPNADWQLDGRPIRRVAHFPRVMCKMRSHPTILIRISLIVIIIQRIYCNEPIEKKNFTWNDMCNRYHFERLYGVPILQKASNVPLLELERRFHTKVYLELLTSMLNDAVRVIDRVVMIYAIVCLFSTSSLFFLDMNIRHSFEHYQPYISILSLKRRI
uniref:Neur_chan_LBD domain-containing protein n=1 Tax=Ascaris lumbricoides TaxID=6252 RepID=A0A0M3I5N0_ASCLU